MKYIITESQYNKTIDKFITYQLEPHEVKKSSDYPDSIFWIKNGEIIAEINNTKYFWVESQIWKTISSMFSLEYSETQQVIKDWMEENYKLERLTPTPFPFAPPNVLEEHYKLEGLTPVNRVDAWLNSWKNIINWED